MKDYWWLKRWLENENDEDVNKMFKYVLTFLIS